MTSINGNGLIANASIGVTQSSGSLTLDGGISGNFALTKVGAGTLTLTGPASTASVNVSAGTLILTQSSTNSVAFSVANGAAAQFEPAGNKLLKTASINTAVTGKLDLSDNKAIVTAQAIGSWSGSNYDGITGQIKSGRNSGAWNGSGIMTSMTAASAASHVTTLAVAVASDTRYGGTRTFGGQSVSPTDVLVMYTYTGDANLTGKIDADDYFQIDSHYNKSGNSAKSYFNGDFNYDGQINGDDYFLIDNAYAGQGAPFSSGALASGVSVVPEPAAMSMLIALSWLCRRGRGSSKRARRPGARSA
jgi:autotransporter-associated beta strand protein